MDLSQYRGLFVSESRGHIQVLNDLIVRLEGSTAEHGAVDEMFRHAHSLKGMSATMQFQDIAVLAHRMEDQLGKVRSGDMAFSSSLADILLEGCDALTAMVSIIEAGGLQMPDNTSLINRLTTFTPAKEPEPAKLAASDNAKTERAGSDQTASSPKDFQARQSDSFKSVRIKTETLDKLVNIAGELITTRYRLTDLALQLKDTKLDESLGNLSSLLRELRDEVFQARMLPFSFIAERFPRLVRDLSRKQGKEVVFQMEGTDIELDRGILEDIAEPLVHILRNAIDHGLETPDQRTGAGKPGQGTLIITVTRDKDFVEICIVDNGCGMDPRRLVSKAVANGLLSQKQADAISPQEALMLICAPGFSTAEVITDISGRGVGMDAVKTAVHSLGGTLVIESETGRGSCFRLRLPISVSIIHALLVQSGRMTIAFPINTVKRTIELREKDLVEKGGNTFFLLDNEHVPLKSLNRQLGMPIAPTSGNIIPAVVIEHGGMPIGLSTDKLLGQKEIFVKPLGSPLSRLECLTGGSIIGDGQIIFVMDASTLA